MLLLRNFIFGALVKFTGTGPFYNIISKKCGFLFICMIVVQCIMNIISQVFLKIKKGETDRHDFTVMFFACYQNNKNLYVILLKKKSLLLETKEAKKKTPYNTISK